MPAPSHLEHEFLEHLHHEKTQVSIFLVNGIKLHGVIEKFDEQAIFLKGMVTQMVFKHAISTVVPGQKAS